MPRHVDEADDLAARTRPVGKAEVDGDAARLFLLQSIGVNARQLADQRSLAVIDVTSRADDHDVASTALTGVSARRRARRPQALPALPEPIGQFTTRSGHVSAGKAARRTAELDEGPPRLSISFSA